MFERIKAENLEDLLLPLGRRTRAGVFFARVCGWDEPTRAGVWAFHEAARLRGVVLDEPLGNPDGDQLAYLTEALGGDFSPEAAFLEERLAKWMPRLSAPRREELAGGMAALFDDLRRQGRNDSALRSLYFKLMAWLYYRFERLMPLLEGGEPPRALLRCPAITAHELALLRLLNGLGTDVMLLEPEGDAAYLRQDPASAFSQRLGGEGPFPAGFTLKALRREMGEPAKTTTAGESAMRPRLTLEPSGKPAEPLRPRLTLEPTGYEGGTTSSVFDEKRERFPSDSPSISTQVGAGAGAAAAPLHPRLTLSLRTDNPKEDEIAPEGGATPSEPALTGPLARIPAPDRLPCTNRWMKAL